MLNQKQFKEFRNDFSKAMKELEKKYNMKVEIGKITYTEDSFSTKLIAKNTKNLNGKSIEEVEFEKVAPLFNLTPDYFNKEFVYNGDTFIIKALNKKAPKFPILAVQKDTNLRYKFSLDVIKKIK